MFRLLQRIPVRIQLVRTCANDASSLRATDAVTKAKKRKIFVKVEPPVQVQKQEELPVATIPADPQADIIRRAQRALARKAGMLKSVEVEKLDPVVVRTRELMKFARRGDPDEAERALQKMVADGIKPNEITFRGVLSGFAKAARPHDAIRVLDDMMQQWQFPASTVGYNMVVKAAAGAGKIHMAFDWVRKMQQRGVAPDLATFATLLMRVDSAAHIDKVVDIARALSDAGHLPSDRELMMIKRAYKVALSEFTKRTEALPPQQRPQNVAAEFEKLFAPKRTMQALGWKIPRDPKPLKRLTKYMFWPKRVPGKRIKDRWSRRKSWGKPVYLLLKEQAMRLAKRKESLKQQREKRAKERERERNAPEKEKLIDSSPY